MSVPSDIRFAVSDLYAAYTSCLDQQRYEEWPNFFAEDCSYRIQPRENYEQKLPLATVSLRGRGGLRDRIYGITSTLFHAPYYQRHIIGPVLMTKRADVGLTVEANYLVIRTKRDEPSELFNAGRYIDHLVEIDGEWRFQDKLCVFDSELIPNSLIYPI